jgi:hypothetical protein
MLSCKFVSNRSWLRSIIRKLAKNIGSQTSLAYTVLCTVVYVTTLLKAYSCSSNTSSKHEFYFRTRALFRTAEAQPYEYEFVEHTVQFNFLRGF